jgi:ornithine cyclodeaminase
MLILGVEETRAALPFPGLVEAVRQMFADGCEMPVRHHHTMEVPGEPDATLLLMPAWQTGTHLGVKIVGVFPGNSARGKAAVNASYVLMSATTGETLAMIDGGELTARRTAAASALAAGYLARKDASRLVVAGTGRLALNLVEAHAAVRPIREVTIWGRNIDKAREVADRANALGFKASATGDLKAAVQEADIVSCATLSATPLIFGEWLKPGIHVDLVGAFRPDTRESDDEAVRRSSVFVDTRAGATKEAGDIVIPIASGALTPAGIKADLYELARGLHPGRQSDGEITLFKSVGAALEDLAGAILAWKSRSGA